MKTTIKYVAAFTALATSVYATNGDQLIGLGAKSRGMGGTGIAISHGAESALANPAMITAVQSNEVSFGGTLFMPNVKTDIGAGAGYQTSSSDLSVIPEIAIASNLENGLYMGIGMWGTAGMGVDYQNSGTNDNTMSNLQLMQFGIPVAYKTGGFSVGITPILQYGALDISYNASSTQGTGQDLSFGYNAGLSYTVANTSLGAVYKSPIMMHYSHQISAVAADYGLIGFTDALEQPAEIGAGVAQTIGAHTVAADYKRIGWSSAAGYKDFGWKDQDVIALGYQFTYNDLALRAGYNYAKSPITQQPVANVNMLNLLVFPAIIESHYTIGASYAFNKSMSFDGAYVYAPETTQSIGTVSTKHSQQSISAQLTYNF